MTDKQLDLFGDNLDPNLEAGQAEDLPFEGKFIFLEPREIYDRAILGILDGDDKLVYDAELTLRCIMQERNLARESAIQEFDYNFSCAKGDHYPEYVWRTEFEIDKEVDL